MANNCPICGKNLTLVGRVHNCVPLQAIDKPLPKQAEKSCSKKKPRKQKPKERVIQGSGYQYRDPEKRRAYMRAYMARKRATK